MKKIVFLLVLAGVGYGGFAWWKGEGGKPLPTPSETAGEKTETQAKSGIRGDVLVGPTCPVVREGEECPDKPYQTRMMLFRTGEEDLFATVKTDANGHFSFEIPPGHYSIGTEDRDAFPRCSHEDVVVEPGKFIAVTIHCDSGIR